MAEQNDIVELVRARNRLEEVVAEDGFPLLPNRGRYCRYMTLTGSLVIDVERQTYSWNICGGDWGDVIRWSMTFKRLDFQGAVKYLAQRAGLPAPDWGQAEQATWLANRAKEETFDIATRVFRRWFEATPEARAYALGRGWTERSGGDEGDGEHEVGTIQRAMLGYSGEGTEADRAEMRQAMVQGGVDIDLPAATAILGMRGDVVGWAKRHGVKLNDTWVLDNFISGLIGYKRLIYPHVVAGRVVYLTGRSIDRKFHYNLPEALVGARRPYYNHVYSPGTDEVIVVEGQADAISLGQWGIDAVALAGVSVETGLGETLKRHKTLYVGLDADQAGRKNTWKICEGLGPLVRLVNWQGALLRAPLQAGRSAG